MNLKIMYVSASVHVERKVCHALKSDVSAEFSSFFYIGRFSYSVFYPKV